MRLAEYNSRLQISAWREELRCLRVAKLERIGNKGCSARLSAGLSSAPNPRICKPQRVVISVRFTIVVLGKRQIPTACTESLCLPRRTRLRRVDIKGALSTVPEKLEMILDTLLQSSFLLHTSRPQKIRNDAAYSQHPRACLLRQPVGIGPRSVGLPPRRCPRRGRSRAETPRPGCNPVLQLLHHQPGDEDRHPHPNRNEVGSATS